MNYLDVFAPELFKDRTVLVTGGGRGIGREIALAFAKLGANCVIASRNPEHLKTTQKEIEELGVQCLMVPTNIRDLESVDGMVAAALEKFGKIDFLINNAGGQFPSNPLSEEKGEVS